jgi:hypothetical protein
VFPPQAATNFIQVEYIPMDSRSEDEIEMHTMDRKRWREIRDAQGRNFFSEGTVFSSHDDAQERYNRIASLRTGVMVYGDAWIQEG